MNRLIAGIAAVLLTLWPSMTSAAVVEDTLCEVVLCTLPDSTQVTLYSVDHCGCQYWEMPIGFLLAKSSPYGWDVLWGGGGKFCECRSCFVLLDLDGSEPKEVLALLHDESNVWGEAIRVVGGTYDDVKVQILPLPTMNNELLFDSLKVAYDSPEGVTLLGKTYDGRTGPTVVYDSVGDSLKVIYIDKDDDQRK